MALARSRFFPMCGHYCWTGRPLLALGGDSDAEVGIREREVGVAVGVAVGRVAPVDAVQLVPLGASSSARSLTAVACGSASWRNRVCAPPPMNECACPSSVIGGFSETLTRLVIDTVSWLRKPIAYSRAPDLLVVVITFCARSRFFLRDGVSVMVVRELGLKSKDGSMPPTEPPSWTLAYRHRRSSRSRGRYSRSR